MTRIHPDLPYVVIIHGDGRGFVLNRRYELIGNAGKEQMVDAKIVNVQTERGWMPTGKGQKPEWTWALPEHEFTAYWVHD